MIQLLLDSMGYEGLFVVSMCLLTFVERFKETRVMYYGVAVPLLHNSGEKCASYEFPVFCVVGGATTLFPRGGRATQNESKHLLSRDFDSTRGFPGEDILSLPDNLLWC